MTKEKMEYYSHGTKEFGRGLTEAQCKQKVDDDIKILKENPNNYPYDFSYEIEPFTADEERVTIFKRRQLTSKGPANPLNFCEDSGVPVTNKNGTPKWGKWYNALEEKVSAYVPRGGSKKNCTGHTLGWGMGSEPYVKSQARADEDIKREREKEADLQKSKANKVQVDFKTESTVEHYEGTTCQVFKEKAREFPANLKPVDIKLPPDFRPGGNPALVISSTPLIRKSFKIDETGAKDKKISLVDADGKERVVTVKVPVIKTVIKKVQPGKKASRGAYYHGEGFGFKAMVTSGKAMESKAVEESLKKKGFTRGEGWSTGLQKVITPEYTCTVKIEHESSEVLLHPKTGAKVWAMEMRAMPNVSYESVTTASKIKIGIEKMVAGKLYQVFMAPEDVQSRCLIDVKESLDGTGVAIENFSETALTDAEYNAMLK